MSNTEQHVVRATAPKPFAGFSAFPLTPIRADRVDLDSYRRLIDRLVEAGVDTIGALGSTGSYAYLSRDERRAVAAALVEHASGTPVLVGIGALAPRMSEPSPKTLRRPAPQQCCSHPSAINR